MKNQYIPSSQKMPQYVFICVLLIISSCQNNNSEYNKTINRSIELSNKTIEANTETYYRSLLQRLTEPNYREKAKIWNPKAEQLKNITSEINSYVDSVKRLLNDSGENLNKKLFNDLFYKIEKYKLSVYNLDTEIASSFSKQFGETNLNSDSLGFRTNVFINKYFKGKSSAEQLVMLSSLQGLTRNLENYVANFCHLKTDKFISCGFGFLSQLIVNQSSTCVKSGETIELKIGIGSFSNTVFPKIKVRGIPINTDPSGVSKYSILTKNDFGKHTIPIQVNFIGQDGYPITRVTEVNYEVIP